MTSLESTIPPPAVMVLTGVLMWLVSRATPRLGFDLPTHVWLGAALGVAGFVIGATGVATFRKAKTTTNPIKIHSSSSLVTWGVYRRSRNPMYLGGLMMLIGWALVLSNVPAFVWLAVYVVYINRFQIAPEERALTSLFGNEYAAYQARVRRWL
jgi:protein-S-isoprenylcysteine O-methyltransferase Ste14